jgi:acyl-CoA thioesterase YciA
MTKDEEDDPDPSPQGELVLQTIALSTDTNQYGDIYGGWLAAKMDLSASITAARIARGTVVTVAIENISFLSPISVGAIVGCYSEIVSIGRSSVTVSVETWVRHDEDAPEWVKVSVGSFVFVAVDDNGRTRAIPKTKNNLSGNE